MKKILVSDFTLKTAYQSELSLTFREKLALAEKLDSVFVDAIELPALVDCKENEVIYRTISQSIKNAIVKIPVGESAESLNFAYECVKGAKKVSLQVVMPVSTTQMEYMHHMKAPAMQEKIGELVRLAKEKEVCVEFIAEDAFRADKDFVVACAKTAFENGACAITLSDDAGDALIEDFIELVKAIKENCDLKVFVKPNDKLNMATAIAIACIKAGADGVKTSSFGENLSANVLSNVMRAKKFNLDAEIFVDATKVETVLSSIDKITNSASSEETESAFSGTLDDKISVKGLTAIVKQLGYELSDADFGKVYDEFKKLVSKKEAIDVKELEAVIASTAMQVPSTYHLVNYVVNSGNIIPATANVTLEKEGVKYTGVSTGDGPIDAAFNAIEQIIGHHYELDDFQVHAATKGRGAVGSSIIRLRADGKLYPGNGASTDIIGACIRAYVNALNKIVYEEN